MASLSLRYTTTSSIVVKEQVEIVEALGQDRPQGGTGRASGADRAPVFPGIGSRMFQASVEVATGLRDKRVYALGATMQDDTVTGISDPSKFDTGKSVVWRAEPPSRRQWAQRA